MNMLDLSSVKTLRSKVSTANTLPHNFNHIVDRGIISISTIRITA